MREKKSKYTKAIKLFFGQGGSQGEISLLVATLKKKLRLVKK